MAVQCRGLFCLLPVLAVGCQLVPLSPEQLAQMRWDRCGELAGTELATITEDGTLLLEADERSSPDTKYLRCIGEVSHEQVRMGAAPASILIDRVYLTDQAPPVGNLSEISGQLPRQVTRITAGQSVEVFAFMFADSAPIQLMTFATSPYGRKQSATGIYGPVGQGFSRVWSSQRIDTRPDEVGDWRVQVRVHGRDAAVLTFRTIEDLSGS